MESSEECSQPKFLEILLNPPESSDHTTESHVKADNLNYDWEKCRILLSPDCISRGCFDNHVGGDRGCEEWQKMNVAEFTRKVLEDINPSEWLNPLCNLALGQHKKKLSIIYGEGFETEFSIRKKFPTSKRPTKKSKVSATSNTANVDNSSSSLHCTIQVRLKNLSSEQKNNNSEMFPVDSSMSSCIRKLMLPGPGLPELAKLGVQIFLNDHKEANERFIEKHSVSCEEKRRIGVIYYSKEKDHIIETITYLNKEGKKSSKKYVHQKLIGIQSYITTCAKRINETKNSQTQVVKTKGIKRKHNNNIRHEEATEEKEVKLMKSPLALTPRQPTFSSPVSPTTVVFGTLDEELGCRMRRTSMPDELIKGLLCRHKKLKMDQRVRKTGIFQHSEGMEWKLNLKVVKGLTQMLDNFFAMNLPLVQEDPRFLNLSVTFMETRQDETTKPQLAHLDYFWDCLTNREVEDLPWISFAPLSKEGMQLHVWPGPGVAKKLNIPFGQMVFLRGDVVHAGGLGNPAPRCHFYVPKFASDIDLTQRTNWKDTDGKLLCDRHYLPHNLKKV